MKKKLYFTNAAPPWKSINTLNTYVNFVYDTKTGELKLVDCFGGETKEVVVATIDKSGSEQGGEGEGGQGGEGGSGEGGDQGGTTPDDGGQSGDDQSGTDDGQGGTDPDQNPGG